MVLPLDPAAIPLAAFQLERPLKQVRKQLQGPVELAPTQGERQLPADQLQRRQHHRPVAHRDRQALAPAGGEIGRHQRPQEPTLHPPAVVVHQIDLQPAGISVVVPAPERAHRHPPPHGAVAPGRAAPAVAAALLADRGQQPIDRGTAYRQHRLPHRRLQRQVPVALET